VEPRQNRVGIETLLYDVFICHASEDKDDFVRPLAKQLEKHHLAVWYDEFSLSVGDSLRQSIDQGLAKSRFGIVVLSPTFFEKGWPQRELNGLVARETAEDRRIILPVWHQISFTEVVQHSPPLADTLALNSADGMQRVMDALLKKLRPDESPLISARDELLEWGIEPPVISDEWWLDIIEASNRLEGFGHAIPPQKVWGTWSFPLPNEGSSGNLRGVRLAWTAMQKAWSDHAKRHSICQLTHPDDVHDFIKKFPGLRDVCLEFPFFLASYAPQLSIPEFSGVFAEVFDFELSYSESKQASEIAKISDSGTGLTIDGAPPLCAEEWAIRHPAFGNYRPQIVASFFLNGAVDGLSSRAYEQFDYLVWLLSYHSSWLPEAHRGVLIQGLADWAVWPNDCMRANDDNAFVDRLYRARSSKTFYNTKRVRQGLVDLIKRSLEELGLADDPQKLADEFATRPFVEGHFAARERLRKKNR